MEREKIERFYSDQVELRLKFFVNGNERVDRAWDTLITTITRSPSNILEVGPGIGAICWRMSIAWPEAYVTGLDLTKDYVEIGTRLFGSSRVRFVHGTLPYPFDRKFDLIVLMDVYEHIALESRLSFNQALKDNLAENGMVFLSFPTPRFQQYLKSSEPAQLQPVDEDISIDVIQHLAQVLEKDILLYKELDVYYTGDYAHVVLGNHGACQKLARPPKPRPSLVKRTIRKVMNPIIERQKPVWTSKKYRKALVESRLYGHN